MNLANPILTAVLFRLCVGAVLILLGAGAIPAPANLITLLVCGAVDVLILWWLIEAAKGAANVTPAPATPAPAGEPAGQPAPAVPAPPAAPANPTAAAPRFTGITATSFGGPGDANSSAYGGMVDPGVPGVALPYHFTGTRPTVRVFYGGKSVDCAVVDVGPWNVNDPYWTKGARPEAESGTDTTGRTTNLAGIDLTPAAWTALGYPFPNSAKSKVDWDFADALASPAPAPSPQVAGPLAVMASIDGTHWISGDGPNPTIRSWLEFIATKYPQMADYCHGAEASSYFAWCGLTVAYCMAKAGIAPVFGADDVHRFLYALAWADFGTAVDTPQPGDVLVYDWGNGEHHVTLYDHETEGNYYASHGGNQSHTVNVTMFPMASCIAIRRPG